MHTNRTVLPASDIVETGSVVDAQLRKILAIVRADVAVILVSALDNNFEVVAATGAPPLPPIGFVLPGGKSICGYVTQQKGAVIFENVSTTERFSDSVMATQFGARSSLIVALRVQGSLVGVLGVHSRTQRAFAASEAEALEAIAGSFAKQFSGRKGRIL